MFEIISDSMKVYENSITSSIKFQIKYELEERMVPLYIEGSVYSENEKYLSSIKELPDTNALANKGNSTLEHTHAIKIAKILNKEKNLFEYKHDLMFELNRNVLDYIENRRSYTTNKNVLFIFHIRLKVIKPNIKVGGFRIKKESEKDDLIISDSENPSNSNPNINILIMINDELSITNNLFEYKSINYREEYTIKSSDWINDFSPKLGLGRFLIVEIPIIDLDIDISTLATDDEKQLLERLRTANKTLQDMEEELRKGEWGNIVAKLRDMELFKIQMTKFIQEIIKQSTGLDENKVREFTTAISNLKNYASELHHTIDGSGRIHEVYTGGKEDAYMAYVLANSITNLISKKFKAYLSRKTNQDK